MLVRKGADILGAGMEKIAGLKPGERTKSFGWSRDKNLVETVNAAWESNKKDLLKQGRWDIESLRFLDREKRIFKNDFLEKMNSLSKDLLNAGDIPFVKRAYKDALGQFMDSNGLKIVSDEAHEYARRRAFEATYKQSNLLSDTIQKWKNTKGVGMLVEAAIPFSKTPANLAARAFEYSPGGLMKALYSKASGKSAAVVIEDLAKGLTGSSIAGLGFLLADMGWAKSERNRSRNAEATLQQMGEQPNSITTPLGSYTFDWAQPLAVPFAMGVVLHEGLTKTDEIDMQTVIEAVASGSDTIFDMSMLRTFKDLLGGGYGSVTEQIASLPASYALQAFPTVLGQAARVVDPIKRNTYDQNKVKQMGKSIAARTPFLSKALEPKLDIFGKEQKQSGAVGQFLNPGFWKEKSDDPITQEVTKLYKATKDTSILPKVAPTYIMSGGKRYDLTPAEITAFQRTMGEKNYTDISKYLKANQSASEEAKTKRLAQIVKGNYDIAKKQFLSGK